MDGTAIPYDSLTMRAVVSELNALLTGGQIQGIRQPRADDIELAVRALGRTRLVLLSCHPQLARMHLTSERAAGARQAGTFAMSLRKHVEGGLIRSVRQGGFDRIAHIEVQAHGVDLMLIVEVMGRHSNILLVDADQRIVDCCRHVGPSVNRLRCLLPGRPYLVPPAPSGDLDPFSGEMAAELDAIERRRRSEWETLLRARLVGVSPFLAKELASRGEHTSLREACSRAFGRAARAEWRAVLVGDGRGGIAGAYPIELECRPASEQSMARSVNDALDRAYGARLERGALESARREALSRISAALSVRSSRLEDARKAEAGGAEADRLSMIADLLLAYGGGQDPAQGYAEVPDPCADDATMRISLDGSQSVPANAEARYARARRLRSAQRWGAAEAPRLEREIAALSEARDRLAEATNCDGVEAAAAGVAHMLRSAPAPGAREGVTHGAETPAGVRRMVGPGGWVILMGQNAEGNDRMLRTMCAPDDLWFHVRAHTSAHVVVRNPARRQAVPDHVIAAAALLAAQNSKAKHSSCVAVDYTQCKHVRRPRKAAHGAVTYSHEKTIHVSPGR